MTTIQQIELYEDEFKTKRKFMKAGTLRLKNLRINAEDESAINILDEICQKVDCNFVEVLDTINRTTR